jgi:hypothetical protein
VVKKSANYGSAHDDGARQQFVPKQTEGGTGEQQGKNSKQRRRDIIEELF